MKSFLDIRYAQMNVFFQTLVKNSPFSDSVKPYLHFIKWEKGQSSPRTLTMDDYIECMAFGKLMARKFDLNVDEKILKKLENSVRYVKNGK